MLTRYNEGPHRISLVPGTYGAGFYGSPEQEAREVNEYY